MKLIIITVLLFIFSLNKAQEISSFRIDMLEFHCKYKAEKIAEKLWQVGVEVEVQEGFIDNEKLYYIELQDLSILDLIEIKENGEIERYFKESLKKKLIEFELIL